MINKVLRILHCFLTCRFGRFYTIPFTSMAEYCLSIFK